MNYTFRKQIKRLLPVLKDYYISGNEIKRNFSIYLIKNNKVNLTLKSLCRMNSYQFRMVSNSKLTTANDSHTKEDSSKKEPSANILDDEEFKSILSDFAKDFDVTSESEQILEDIKKSMDDSSEDDPVASQDTGKNYSISHKNVNSYTESRSKFKEFTESDAVVIPSYEEQQSESDSEEIFYHIDQSSVVTLSSEELKRGIHGVFDIAELIKILRKENLVDVTTISVPKELHYADFLVIATAKSLRHSKAICENVIKLYKMKKHLTDPFVIVEGDKESNWKAIDMGNIVLHVFLEEARILYDIESLWLFDSDFDKGRFKKADPLYDAMEEQIAFFNTLNSSTSATNKK